MSQNNSRSAVPPPPALPPPPAAPAAGAGTEEQTSTTRRVACFSFNALKTIRGTVSKKKIRYQLDEFDLDLTYVTPRIIAMGFPSSGAEGMYRNPMPEVQRFFEERHPGHYRIYNLCSERSYDPAMFCGRAARYAFDDHNPCPLWMLAEFCEDVDGWLAAHPENVVAIHCKAGKGRTGLVISAYLVHCGMFGDPEQALQYFGLRRTSNGKGVTIPSQMRYVHYYWYTLRNGIPPALTLRLTHIRMVTVPNVENGACVPSVEVLAGGHTPIFDLRRSAEALTRYTQPQPYMDLDLTPFDIRVRGDVKLQFYHGRRKNLCHLWFHTAFVDGNHLRFDRSVVDKACKDKKGTFPAAFAIEILLHAVDEDPARGGSGSFQSLTIGSDSDGSSSDRGRRALRLGSEEREATGPAGGGTKAERAGAAASKSPMATSRASDRSNDDWSLPTSGPSGEASGTGEVLSDTDDEGAVDLDG